MAQPQQRSGQAVTRDGITLPYTIHGEERNERPGVVLVHSLAMSGEVWQPVADRLAAATTVLTYDCRGHGRSSRPPGPYRLQTFADDLRDLLDVVGWSSAYLAGASMGGSVAMQFAVLHPTRVRGLGLMDTTAWYGADAAERWEERARQAEENGLPRIIDFQEARWFTPEFLAGESERVRRCRAVFLANDVACFAASGRMLGAFDVRAGLPALRMPTAVIVGEEDYATPVSMAREIQSSIPGATLQVIPKARHLTFVEHPDLIAQALSELLQRPAGTGH